MSVEATEDGIVVFAAVGEPTLDEFRTKLAKALAPQRAKLPPLLLLDARGLSADAGLAGFEVTAHILAELLADGFTSRIAVAVPADHIVAGVRAIGLASSVDVPISVAWLQKIAVVAPGVIYSFRLRPDGTTCFPYSSPSIERLFGLRPEEMAQDASLALVADPS